MDAVNHFAAVGVNASGNKKCGRKTSRRDPETNGHLLYGAGDGAGTAGLLFADIGIGKDVHACILQ